MRHLLKNLLGLLANLPGQDPPAFTSLERVIATARHAHASARRALAIAEEAREAERSAVLTAKVSELEKRVVQALRARCEDLAAQAAEAIGAMTTEIVASKQASERFAVEVAMARREVDGQRRHLSDLDRGRRLARIGVALNAAAPALSSDLDSFAEAEAAPAQVVSENQDARFVRDVTAPPAEQFIERMAEAGLGDPVQPNPADVLAGLRSAAGLPVMS